MNHYFIQETLNNPNIDVPRMLTMAVFYDERASWTTLIARYIEQGNLPSDPTETSLVNRRSSLYSLIEGMLYKRGIPTSLLKCLEKEEASHALAKVHKRIVRQYLGARTLARKFLRARYY